MARRPGSGSWHWPLAAVVVTAAAWLVLIALPLVRSTGPAGSSDLVVASGLGAELSTIGEDRSGAWGPGAAIGTSRSTTLLPEVAPEPEPEPVEPPPTTKPAPPTPPITEPPPPPSPTTTTTTATAPPPPPPSPTGSEEGQASWYELPGARAGTCAHKTLPFGTVVVVHNLGNGRSTTCTVGDRGPFAAGKIVDLFRDDFARLAPLGQGVARVRIEW